MFQYLIRFLFIATACAGCAAHHQQQYTIATSLPKSDVSVLRDASSTHTTLDAALPEFSTGDAPIPLPDRRPVISVQAATQELEKISNRPLLAATEYKDWFWFATDVDKDAQTQAIRVFNGGYAVQKGGYLAWKWGTD